jgi:hypothetical protein
MGFPSRVAVSDSVISPKEVAADIIADGEERGVNSFIPINIGSGLFSGFAGGVRVSVDGVFDTSMVLILRIDVVGVGVMPGVGVAGIRVRVWDEVDVGVGVEITLILVRAYASAGKIKNITENIVKTT